MKPPTQYSHLAFTVTLILLFTLAGLLLFLLAQ